MKTSLFVIAPVAVFCVSVTTGCATRGDIESLREDISALKRTTNEALEISNQARNASSDSQAEMQLIRRELAEASRRSELNREKLDAVFEKSMLK